MELINYISNDNITVQEQDTVAQVLNYFNKIPYSHLPIVKSNVILGNIAKEDLIEIDDKTKKIKDLSVKHLLKIIIESKLLL